VSKGNPNAENAAPVVSPLKITRQGSQLFNCRTCFGAVFDIEQQKIPLRVAVARPREVGRSSNYSSVIEASNASL
jgi:hypothetical protein